MFISTFDLFTIGIGPSSSHTIGPMAAAAQFLHQVSAWLEAADNTAPLQLHCILKGSLSFTGRGHATDRAVTLGLHGYTPEGLATQDVDRLVARLEQTDTLTVDGRSIDFHPRTNIIFDRGEPLPEHPNGMIFELRSAGGGLLLSETWFSIGGGFIATREELAAVQKEEPPTQIPWPFSTGREMLQMAADSGRSVAQMKRENEQYRLNDSIEPELGRIWQAMRLCVERGLATEGILPGGLGVIRRAKALHSQLVADPQQATINDWLCACAMAVSEENAAGHLVVTAPTNGAAGVIPAVLYCFLHQEGGDEAQVEEFLLTAGAIGGLIKHHSSISGAEVGCQGEIGSASAMAAAGLCAVKGGDAVQIENAAEIALEHHMGLTCDPVNGLVQVPCIERNGFGAIKAWTAASLALRGNGQHFMPLDSCIKAMKQTGLEMSSKFKETSLGGLAVSYIEC